MFEICVYNQAAEDYVIARICTDVDEAIMYLRGLSELNLDACIRYFTND